jgi:hypothetical protein
MCVIFNFRSITVLGQDMEALERWRDSTASAYSSYYNTQGINPSRKGHREDMPIVMRVKQQHASLLSLPLRLFIVPHKKAHAKHKWELFRASNAPTFTNVYFFS